MQALRALFLAALVTAGAGCGTAPERATQPCTQLVVVTTASWTAVDARLQRYERSDAAGPWVAVGAPIEGVVGRAGLAWGLGEHAPRPQGPTKREGDGCAPAGTFALLEAFGYVSHDRVPFVRLPYRELTKTTLCVDDPASRSYNRVFEALGGPPLDWKSAETMLREDALYALGVVVGHNRDGIANAGSCIFLHSWVGPGLGTAGCTAVSAADLEALLRWLDPRRAPRVVQAPRSEADFVRSAWPGIDL